MAINPELDDNLTQFSETVSEEVKALRRLINGNKLTLSLLRTSNKANLVAAINELVDELGTPVSLEDINIVLNDYFVLHPQSFTYEQNEPAMTWLITHPLDHTPAVLVTDSAGTIWKGQVTYPRPNQVRIEFNFAMIGKAILT